MSYTNGLDKPSDYFNTVLNTGDNTSPKAISGVGFQPDLVWTKSRTSGTTNHTLFDSVRGAGGNKELSSNSTAAEGGNQSSAYGYLSSFDSDGFTATIGSIGANYFNQSGETYVNWNWKAGGTASSNTVGDITSNVSANTTSGFSIVSYTGTGSNPSTVGHGLSAVPKMIIVKMRDGGTDWFTYHQGIGNANTILLNTTNTSFSSSVWNSTTPTSSVFTLGANDVNSSGNSYIAYCFAEKKGFSKFGKYVGNNNDDGTFIYLGFKPAFLLIKIIDTQTDNWIMQDNKRNTFNLSTSQRLRANSLGAEFSSSNEIDLLSNGFKVHGADGEINGSGASYIYMAFAESPFTTSTGIPTTAR